jgi:uncharacterized protein
VTTVVKGVSDDVFVLPVLRERLVFSPRRQLAALVNAAAVRALTLRGQAGTPEDGLPPAVRELAALLEQPAAPVPLRSGPARPILLGLVVTRACNMACRYCDFAAARLPGAAMAPELARAAIAAWVQHQRNLGESLLNLHFFGGEPFVEGDLVQMAVHRTRALAAKHGLATHFEAATNGRLSARDLAFVRDYFDTIVLSLDGPQPDQDRHRPLPDGRSAFAQVRQTALTLSDSPVDLCLRCCVSNANVAQMEATAAWFVGEFRPSVVVFEPLSPTREAALADLAPPDPVAFARGFLRARRISCAAGVPCEYGATRDGPQHTFCPVGQDAFIVAPSGSVRSCYLRKVQWEARGLDLEIGRVDPADGLAIDEESVHRLRAMVADRPRCRTCFCRWSCAGGCLVRETWPGRGLEPTDFCRQTRLIQAGLLLEDLGQAALADELLADRSALERLASQADDRLGGEGPARAAGTQP